MGGTEVDLGGIPLPLLYSAPGRSTRRCRSACREHAVSGSGAPGLGAVGAGVVHGGGGGAGDLHDEYARDWPGRDHEIRPGDAGTGGHAAARGEVIVIYCAGLGAVNPPVNQGDAPTTASRTVNEATVTIGGMKADVQYAGVTPGYAGLYQVNGGRCRPRLRWATRCR